MQTSSPVVKHLVLVGGGHSHLAVLKRLGMKPVPGLAVTLISRDIDTPYSGSLPGFISGLYGHNDIHIDLRPLARFAGVRLIQEEVGAIDLAGKWIDLQSRPSIPFDVLSLNIGSRPDAGLIAGASKHAIGIKPIDRFLEHWAEIQENAVNAIVKANRDYRIAIVGGGPAGVELACSARYRLHELLDAAGANSSRLKIRLVSADGEILDSHNERVRNFVRKALDERNIETLCRRQVTACKPGSIVCKDGTTVDADVVIFATGASIPEWPFTSGLAAGEDGFIAVNRHLQSTSHEFVFVAGDAAGMVGEPRPKSGVFAVRQGKVLATNLVRYCQGRRLKSYRPQRHALALISLGGRNAIASRHKMFFQGRWVWPLKHRIDSGFVRSYSRLPTMPAPLELAGGLVDKATEQQLRNHAMRCAGCGAKVAGDTLQEVLTQLPKPRHGNVLTSPTAVEDASIVRLDDGRVLVQSVDQLRAFIDDPLLFARITTNHCLSDLYAMGCQPHSALALASLPFASRPYLRAQLGEVMRGCSETLQEHGCDLIGGHTAESDELFLGLCINGFAAPDSLLGKRGMEPGDVLVLNKALGSGVLLAADARCKASHQHMQAALDAMVQSNETAAAILLQHGARACTDISGFGLAGHLLEMLTADRVEVELELDKVLALNGALETLEQGIRSSLHGDNRLVADYIDNLDAFEGNPHVELLFDPQTAGGLLASIPAAAAEDCLRSLRESGYSKTAIIGGATATNATRPSLILR